MRGPRLLAFAAALCALAASAPAGAQAAAPAQAPAPKAMTGAGFRAEGSMYVATGTGKGASAAQAESQARAAALRSLFAGLGKDGLFAEVFTGSPPLGLDFSPPTTVKEGSGYSSTATLRIDDESVRIVERGPYLAAAISLLDKADESSAEAQASLDRGREAEAAGSLGEALNAYGMAKDAAQGALGLIEPVGDASIFSSERKRTAPDLKLELAAQRDAASAGIERIREAEAALEADASGKAAQTVIDGAIAAADAAQALLDENQYVLQNPSTQGAERLAALRDRLALESRSLSDSKAALARAAAAIPAGKGYISDKADFAKRRLATASSSVEAAYRTVDREIRDPAPRRAARAQALRWVFLHEPREYLSVRAYLPFDLEAGNPNGIEACPFEFAAGLEGAFSLGGGGLWARSVATLDELDLSPSDGSADEFAFAQSFDLGFYGRTLVFGGLSWDWLRTVGPDKAAIPRPALLTLGLGGVSSRSSGGQEVRRADWLLGLSYQLPYSANKFMFSNAFNLGLDAQFRLGSIALLEAEVSHRLHRKAQTGALSDFAAVMSWAIGLGIRLPSPFAWGVEYGGDLVWPFDDSGDRGQLEPFRGGRFRFFVQYSI